MLSPEGKLLKRIAKETRPRAITEAERDGYRAKYAEALKHGMQIAFRDRLPAFSGLFFDDQGRILVRTYERAGGSGGLFSYDVFDKDGLYECRVAIPLTLDGKTVWKAGKAYTVEHDENGLSLIKRHRIRWTGRRPRSSCP
jgi:hypothetical protein